MRIWTISIGIGALAALVFLTAAQQVAEIAGNRMKAHVNYLAADELEGRGVGTKGGKLTEGYLATQLAAVGAKPAGENNTYFQTVSMVGVLTQPTSTLSAVADAKSLPFKWQDEFVGGSLRQNRVEQFEADAVFIGHGIVSPSENWNDYKSADVKGKIVVLFTNEPQPENPEVFKGKALTYAGRWVYKFEEAARRGALGAIIIHTTPTAGYGWDVVRNSWGKEDPQMKLEAGRHSLAFAGWLSESAGSALLNLSDHTIQELLNASDSRDFQPIPLRTKIRGRLNAEIRKITSRNVLGYIPGSDSIRRDEYVMYSAHWDHLGIGVPVDGDAIYNGAIDNATGCAIVLELARAWSALKQKPGRSALFAFWTAEESGLRGAEHFATHPTVPTKSIAVNINYDALFPSARTKDIVITGAERTSVWPIVQEAAQRMEFELAPDPRPEQGSYYRSDHFMMAKIGIPAFSVRTGTRVHGRSDEFAAEMFREYNTKRYHQPSDEHREEWNFASLEYAARFGFLIGLNVANSTSMPSWNVGDEFAVR